MGRKARYCCFHSLEGSGAQHRNNIICGVLLEDCVRDEELADKVHLLCPSFLNYSTSTPSQTRELKEIQERATRLGRRHEFTIRKLYHIHEQSGWQWTNANNKIRDALNAIERSVGGSVYASSVVAEQPQQQQQRHEEEQPMNQPQQQEETQQQQQPVKKQRVQKKKQVKEQQKADEHASKTNNNNNDSPMTPASESSYEEIQMKEILSELVKEPAAPEEVLDFWSSTILPVPQALSTSSSNLLSTSSSNLLAAAAHNNTNNHHVLGHSIIASRVPSFPHPLSRAPVSRSNSNTSLLDACKTDFLNGNNFLFSLGRTN